MEGMKAARKDNNGECKSGLNTRDISDELNA